MATPTRSRRKFLTYRVQNIPDGTSKEELKGYFYMEDRDDIKIKSLCPSVDTPEGQEGDYTATIFFRPHEDFERQPRIAIDTIDIDKTFIGFTPLHVPSREQGPIAAEYTPPFSLRALEFPFTYCCQHHCSIWPGGSRLWIVVS